MNFQELNQNEMTEINGGGLLDGLLGSGNSSGGSQGGLSAILGLNSLFSFSTKSANGSTTAFTLGKGLSLNLGSIFNGL